MCGLFFSIGFAPNEAYIDAVAHRGPDGRGWKVFDSPAGPVAMGHRRLSIIDLDDRALQPLASADGRHWLIFNGEIYNYLELREDLRRAGVTFRTESDAEVLLEAYRVWGVAAIDRFIGMFAFVIWDNLEKKALIVRDRLGIKPLVYHASRRGIAFGSEIKQLLALPGFERRINLDRAHNFLSNGITDHLPETMFTEAFNLTPGNLIELDLGRWKPGGDIAIRAYWTAPSPEPRQWTERQAAERFRELFDDSIRLHLRADVRVGACLSGGLDSSAIVCRLADMWPPGAEKLNAISAVFPNTAVDESRFALDVTKKTGAAFLPVTFDAQAAMDDLQAVLHAQDEPYGSLSIHAQYRVFKAAREAGVKVMLDGQGADEILGGYHGCFYYHYRRLITEFRVPELIQTLSERQAWHGASWRTELAPFTGRLGPLRKLLAPPSVTGGAAAPRIESDLLNSHRPPEGGAVQQVTARLGLGTPVELGHYCTVLTRATNLPMLLRYEDRNSMAHGVEARVPFLDHRLVEFALKLGNQHKIVGGDTKRVLRRAMADTLPPTVLNRRDKLGFATPEEAWFKGPLRKVVEDSIEDTLAFYPDLFVPTATRDYARLMLDGALPFNFSLWRIMVLGMWGKTYGVSMS